ncbi:MAG: hypothetical protein K6T80_01995 [Firmicutes bacterium]|nr:hypothetical protein [Bacillota bacterium]
MKRFLYPLIFLMSSMPDAEKHLDALNSLIQATQMSVKNIRDGLEAFHSTMVQINQFGDQVPNPANPRPAGQAEPAPAPGGLAPETPAMPVIPAYPPQDTP